jgi:guanosine-3',5'-bis(diphosphate) 3'-pyrophosphohydrolase
VRAWENSQRSRHETAVSYNNPIRAFSNVVNGTSRIMPAIDLLERVGSYLPPERARLVADALEYADVLHNGQHRRSGGPYIDHPISVATYLAELSLDATTIAAALLHDVIEDCGVTTDELASRFGEDVARLVDGVTKLTRLDEVGTEVNQELLVSRGIRAESLRKMLIAMAEDIRVVLIKLADRLHNMKTLGALAPARRIVISQETLDIYAPLAHRLGMGEMKWQLEDMAFRYLQPTQYRSISKLLASKRQEREEYIQQVTDVLKINLAKNGFDAEVTGRPKHIYSIHNKAEAYAAQGKHFGDIYDLFAVRILVDSVQGCYGALGVVHSLWRPVPGQFDDYIANPKENMYQGLHTSVRAIGGVPIEVQLRTHEMHQIAEYGVASHWRYKGDAGLDVRFDEKLVWLRQLLEWRRDLNGAEEFLESVKTDIFRDQVFVYTPKNEIKELPSGSTPIDFAYQIHTDLGHRCIGAKLNGKLVSLNVQLHSGDTVEILTTAEERGPSIDWLNPHLGYVHSVHARHAIRAWFRRQEQGANILRGQELLARELERLNIDLGVTEIAKFFAMESAEDLELAIGSGQTSITHIAARIAAHQEQQYRSRKSGRFGLSSGSPDFRVLGVGDLPTRLARCCEPVPNAAIVAYVTRTRGVTVHRRDCSNLPLDNGRQQMIPVSWGRAKRLYPVNLVIEALDRVGLLHDITGMLSADGIGLAGSQTNVSEDGSVSIYLTIRVVDMEQLSRAFSRIEQVRGVRNVSRNLYGQSHTDEGPEGRGSSQETSIES